MIIGPNNNGRIAVDLEVKAVDFHHKINQTRIIRAVDSPREVMIINNNIGIIIGTIVIIGITGTTIATITKDLTIGIMRIDVRVQISKTITLVMQADFLLIIIGADSLAILQVNKQKVWKNDLQDFLLPDLINNKLVEAISMVDK